MVEKLAASEDEDALEPLLSVLADEDLEVRRSAAKGLGRLRSPDAVDSLVAALRDPQPEMRQTAAQALKAIGDKKATSALASMLKDDNASVRYHVVAALEALNWIPQNDGERALRSVAMGKLDQAANYGGAAVEAIAGELRTGVHYKRIEAVEALAKINDARVVKPLIAALKDEDGNVRAKAVEVLSRIGDARAVEPLITALKDRDSRVRASAVEALCKFGDARAIQALTGLLHDGSAEVRSAAAEALAKINDPSAIDSLIKLLSDVDNDIRQMAVKALGKLGDPRAVGPLVTALIDRHETVRQFAEAALVKINPEWDKSPEAFQAVPVLEAAAQDKEYWVRQSATTVLKRIVGDIAPAENSEEQITTVTDRTQQRRRDAAHLLANLLSDADRDVRLAAATALQQIGSRNSIPQLVEALADQDNWVRRAVVKTLHVLNWQPEDEKQMVLYCVATMNWDKLGEMGITAIAGVEPMLHDSNPEIRKTAVGILGRITDAAAMDLLLTMLHDSEKVVRKAAANALMANWMPSLNEAQQLLLGLELA